MTATFPSGRPSGATHPNSFPTNLWQRRFWAHVILDDADYAAHIDYCHITPLKHGLVEQVADWPYSTFHRYVERGVYPLNWATQPIIENAVGERG